MTTVVKVKPKPSPVSKALPTDSPNVIKEEVSSLSSDTVGFFKQVPRFTMTYNFSLKPAGRASVECNGFRYCEELR
ncbi:hypothetical protein RHMOL_Rhmol06G0023100 [Rhododendron molle]|uniref:Uncharacterized protein n=1 Tax=Rhododendron molle TaxID=49168 RepID=A0ACC0N9D3_RHOML|nr:hypothetical protein RHMOL_Rhmol06G0023100 [Rhododendron molle]